jgi:hypothetical protein
MVALQAVGAAPGTAIERQGIVAAMVAQRAQIAPAAHGLHPDDDVCVNTLVDAAGNPQPCGMPRRDHQPDPAADLAACRDFEPAPHPPTIRV